MVRALWIVLCVVFSITTLGCKYVYGEAYQFLSVNDPQTGNPVNLFMQVVIPPRGAVALNNGLYPGLVFVHGGGWGDGDRFDNGFDKEIKVAAEKGYVAATIDYRLVRRDAAGNSIFPWPAQIQDLHCAIRFLKANAVQFGLDPERIAVVGISAGGQMALMAAEAPANPAFEAPECQYQADSEIAAAIALSGVADVETTWNDSAIVAQMLATLADVQVSVSSGFSQLDEVVHLALSTVDPLAAVGAVLTPVLLINPIDDTLVPVANSRRYIEVVSAQGRDACLLVLDRGGHFTGSDGGDAMAFAKAQMYGWLEGQLLGVTAPLPCGAYPDSEFLLSVPYL